MNPVTTWDQTQDAKSNENTSRGKCCLPFNVVWPPNTTKDGGRLPVTGGRKHAPCPARANIRPATEPPDPGQARKTDTPPPNTDQT